MESCPLCGSVISSQEQYTSAESESKKQPTELQNRIKQARKEMENWPAWMKANAYWVGNPDSDDPEPPETYT